MSTLYEYQHTPNIDQALYSDDFYIYSAFTPTYSHTISSIKLTLWRVGTCDLVITVKYTDASHKPTGSVLATVTVASADIPTSSTVTEIDLTTTLLVNTSHEYAVILNSSGSDGVSNYINILAQVSG